MTLFKKVFESHFSEDVSEPEPQPAVPLDFDEVDEIVLQPGMTEPLQEPDTQLETTAEDAISILSRIETVPSEPEAQSPPTMAERAALAHAQMRHPVPEPTQETTQIHHPATQPIQSGPEPVHTTPMMPVDLTPEEAPAPRSRGRVKTRLLGFHQGADTKADPFANADTSDDPPPGLFPTGWLVVTGGPGEGNAMAIYGGVSTIGRGDDQALKLDFGDTSISRQNHALIAYDAEQNKFFLGHGGKSNIIRLNDRPVLSTEDLSHGDILRIGETTLRFVALCGVEFKWSGPDHDRD